MGLAAPIPNRFNGIITNLTGQPTTTWGTSVATSASANTLGSYVEILPNTAYDTFYMELEVNTIGSAAASTNALMTIGIDHAGGTTYTDVEIANLLVSGAGVTSMGAIHYRFPLYIPANSAVAAKWQENRASSPACHVGIRLYGKPSKPELVRAGAYVDTFGATTASSSGTAVTPGTASEGTVVQIGTNLTRNYWWWQGGVGIANTVQAGGGLYTVLDVGVGQSSAAIDWVFQNQRWAAQNTSEQDVDQLLGDPAYVFETKGDGTLDVFARMQASGTPDTGISCTAYALGG